MGIVNFLRNIGQLQDSHSPAPINSNPENYPVEYVRTMSFNEAFKDLLSQDQFIARSNYKDLVEQYRDLSQFYATLVQSNILNEYVAKHNLDMEAISYFRAKFDEMADPATESPTIRKHNEPMFHAISNRRNPISTTYSKPVIRLYRSTGNSEKWCFRKKTIHW